MKWTNVPHGTIKSATERLWGALGDNADEVARRLSDTTSPLAEEIASLINNRCVPPEITKGPCTYGIGDAAKIMGKNFFGQEDACELFGVPLHHVRFGPTHFGIPWSERTLDACKDTHLLAAACPLSMVDMHWIEQIRTGNTPSPARFCLPGTYGREAFATQMGGFSWQLIRKNPVARSGDRGLSEQQELLLANEETPSARVLVYALLGYQLKTGERLFPLGRTAFRSSDTDSDGRSVCVVFELNGTIRLASAGMNEKFTTLGLAAARKKKNLLTSRE